MHRSDAPREFTLPKTCAPLGTWVRWAGSWASVSDLWRSLGLGKERKGKFNDEHKVRISYTYKNTKTNVNDNIKQLGLG